ncbi:LamG-like jellyroll fold domain-containing protein [uncultured Tenacibaculum sp.]|uniref:LamG-like jellyroll fold domain-containing protein n=1 Tax=uncultured Tenacibaculum sp. TaxID=174713 RepID=UPI0026192A52|nr:LamG-like jellyroll fold domain-containing protein [uncultured Tenacibaculum sp.]
MRLNYTKTAFILGVCFSILLGCSCDDDASDNPNTPLENDNLIAYYPFDDSLLDASTNNLNGQAIDAVFTKDRNSKDSLAYNITGEDDQVISVPNFPVGKGSLSISFWINIDVTDVQNDDVNFTRYIFSKREICDISNFFNFTYKEKSFDDPNTNILSWEIRQADGSNLSVSAKGIAKGRWVYVTGVLDNENKKTALYLDAGLAEEVSWDANIDVDLTNNAPFEIGANICERRSDNVSGLLKANIDELAFFNSTLSQQEITDYATY